MKLGKGRWMGEGVDLLTLSSLKPDSVKDCKTVNPSTSPFYRKLKYEIQWTLK